MIISSIDHQININNKNKIIIQSRTNRNKNKNRQSKELNIFFLNQNIFKIHNNEIQD